MAAPSAGSIADGQMVFLAKAHQLPIHSIFEHRPVTCALRACVRNGNSKGKECEGNSLMKSVVDLWLGQENWIKFMSTYRSSR